MIIAPLLNCAASFNQDSERIGQISTRLYVNSLQSTGSRSLNVFKAIVKEHNTVSRRADWNYRRILVTSGVRRQRLELAI